MYFSYIIIQSPNTRIPDPGAMEFTVFKEPFILIISMYLIYLLNKSGTQYFSNN